MKVHFDEQADAVYVRLDDSRIIESEEVQPGILLDFNEHKQVVGIEILRVSQSVPEANPKQIQFEVAQAIGMDGERSSWHGGSRPWLRVLSAVCISCQVQLQRGQKDVNGIRMRYIILWQARNAVAHGGGGEH